MGTDNIELNKEDHEPPVEYPQKSRLAVISLKLNLAAFLLCIIIMALSYALENYIISLAHILPRTWPCEISGVLFLLPLLPALPGIVTGHMAQFAIWHARGKLSGRSRVLIGLVISYLVVWTMLPTAVVNLEMGNVHEDSQRSSALSSLRTIHGAQRDYREAGHTVIDGVAQYGTLEQLVSPSFGTAYIDESLGLGKLRGYTYKVTIQYGAPPAYTCSATPVEYRDGMHNFSEEYFFIDESGIIRINTGSSATAESISYIFQ